MLKDFIFDEDMMPADFIFDEDMIREAYLQKNNAKIKNGQIPFHRSIEKKGYLALLAWNTWVLLVPFLKKELRKRCPNKSLSESNGNPLFLLRHVDKTLKLHILQPWAAKKLGLPKIYIFNSQTPIEAYAEIVCKFK
jgi:hypothetical protein